MKIALLTDGIYPFVIGGMQKHSFDLAKHLLLLGTRLTLVHCVTHDVKLPDEEEVAAAFECDTRNLKIIGLKFPKPKLSPGHYVRESYKYSVEIFETLKSEWCDFDFIYAKGFCAWHLLEEKKNGRHLPPIGIKFHGYEMFQKSNKVRTKLEQFLLKPAVVFNNREADYIFSYGGGVSEIIEKMGVDRSKIIEIPAGIDKSWVKSDHVFASGKRRFLFIGRNEFRKGIADLNKAINNSDDLNVEFQFVAPIPEEDKLHRSNVTYHGQIMDKSELQEILDNCHILIVPSHSEGMPNVILEAMARGLAVIATDVGAVPMMVNSMNGIIIPPRKVKELEKAIREFSFMPDHTLYELQKSAIKTVVESFSWTRIAEKVLESIKLKSHSERNLK